MLTDREMDLVFIFPTLRGVGPLANFEGIYE